MRRARIQYFVLLGQALALFGAAAWLTPGAGDGWATGLVRFVVLVLAILSAVATWGTAIMIASLHRRSWALWLSTALVIVAGLTFFVSCYRLPS